ncbi:HEAT repeat domain-containing protein [Natroniella sulfidigena]|uniref:HEAT repeat domain-containing protein n=1 Tax=Natroniella sulfidigena TaxID=723921 RepID=UPI00200AEEEF|nr:HEAT repeat domain-containing protein [Natroniella sulfidigena]MCK8817301.1 HEAT repeat domain-containing protein [Natroniella sulfidigena]
MFISYIDMLQEINFFYFLIIGAGIISLFLIKYFKSNSKLDYELVVENLKKNDLSILEQIEESKIKKRVFLDGKKDLEPKIYLDVKKYLLDNGLIKDCFKDLVFVEQKEEKILACKVLSKVGTSQTIDYCVTALYDQDSEVKNSAIKALTDNANPKVVDTFIDYIDHCNDEVLLSMLTNAFEKIGYQAFEQLKRVAFEGEEMHRVWATKLLRDIEDDETNDLLLRLLDDHSEQVRIEAIRGLARHINQEKVFNALIEKLNDSNWKVRNQVVTILGELSDRQVCSHLFQLIDDEQRMIRVNVCHALIKSGYEGIKYLIKATEIKESKQEALQALDELDIEFLMKAVQNIYEEDEVTTTEITKQLAGIKGTNETNESLKLMES